MAATPFSVIDDALHEALTAWTPLTALVHADRIMRPDRSVDIRGIESAADLRPKIWILPDASPVDVTAGSNNLVDLHFSYTIAVVQKDANQQDMRELEYEIHRAFLMLLSGHKGSGAPLVNPLPFLFIAPWFKLDRITTLHFEPGQPQSWKALFSITVRAGAEQNAILPPYPTNATFSVGAGATAITFDRPLDVSTKAASNWSQIANGFSYPASIVLIESAAPTIVNIVWGSPLVSPDPNSISYTAAVPDIVDQEFSLAALPFLGYPIDIV